MNILTDLPIAPEESVGLQCPKCSTYVKREEWDEVGKFAYEGITCLSCGEVYDPPAAKISIVSPSHHLTDITQAVNETWYHATISDSWAEDTLEAGLPESNLLVHLGLKETALARINDLFMGAARDFYLYEVKLSPEVTLHPSILNDDNNWSKYSDDHKMPIDFNVTPAVRYVNRWETPGYISLLADRTKLTVINHSRQTNQTNLS